LLNEATVVQFGASSEEKGVCGNGVTGGRGLYDCDIGRRAVSSEVSGGTVRVG